VSSSPRRLRRVLFVSVSQEMRNANSSLPLNELVYMTFRSSGVTGFFHGTSSTSASLCKVLRR